jgi:hypothetical protein
MPQPTIKKDVNGILVEDRHLIDEAVERGGRRDASKDHDRDDARRRERHQDSRGFDL